MSRTTLAPEEHAWREKANAVPEFKRGLDLKGLLYMYSIVDHITDILQKHQGLPSDLPEEQELKLMVSLLHARLVSYEHLHLTKDLDAALPYLLEPHVTGVHQEADGRIRHVIPSDLGLRNLAVTPKGLLRASTAALWFRFQRHHKLAWQTSRTVSNTVKEKLSPDDKAQLQALLQRHQAQLGIPDLLWVMATIRTASANKLAETTDAKERQSNLMEVKAGALDMLSLRPDIPLAHHVLGTTLVECRDPVSARMYYEQGIQVADETSSHYHACLLRFDLAFALLNGADGHSFRKGDVEKLLTEAYKLEKQLREWKPPEDMTGVENIKQGVLRAFSKCPEYQALPDSHRLQLTPLLPDNKSPQGACSTVCNGCGLSSTQLRKCKACRSVAYCSTQCQKAHWKAHKQDCKRMRLERAPQSAG